MKFTLSWLVVMLAAVLWCGSFVHAQDKKVPEPEAIPSLPKEFAKESPKTGLAATGANAVLVTPRGAFALPFTTGAKGCAGFEYGGKGYDSKVVYSGFQDNFHYWKVEDWQITVAVRNTATGGKFDVYFFINGGTVPTFYSQGAAYPAP